MSASRAHGPHGREGVQDLLDGRLTPQDAASVRAHLETCLECQHEWRRLEAARAAAALLRAPQELPGDFEATLRAQLNQVEVAAQHEAPETEDGTRRAGWRRDRRAWLAAAAASIAALAVAIWRGRSDDRDDLVAGAFANHVEVVAERVPLESRTSDAAQLVEYFAAAGLPDIRVLDLSMMGYVLEGGRLATVAGSPAALYVYRGPSGARLVCQMYRGSVDALPVADAVRPGGPFAFHLFTREETTAVFWQEGPIVCVLTAALDAETVFKLAVEKAMLPA